MTPSKLATATASLLLAAGLSACSGEPDGSGDPSSSSSSSADSSTTDTGGDTDVFSTYKAPKVLGSTSGTVSLGINAGAEEKVTFEVTGLTATEDATILRYQVTADDGDASFGMEGRRWYEQPGLREPGSDTTLQSVTASLPKGHNTEAQERCVCTSVRSAGEDPRPQTVMFDALPEKTTEVEVILPGLDPVTVPVTR